MPRIAVLIPCYNEAASIAGVLDDFKAALPDATLYVYDNNSADETAAIAVAHGAVLRRESLQGKGHVVRRMFADVEADIYVLVDGDATYDAASSPQLVQTLLNGPYDMVNAARVEQQQAAYRPGHRFGNRLISGLVVGLFGRSCRDVLSGYRVFSRRFVKSFPALARGFEIETELTVHGLQLRMPVTEVETPYRERPAGSFSKLNTVRDGARILLTIIHLVKEEKPLAFFSSVAGLFALGGVGFGIPIMQHYLQTGLVPRLPTFVLVIGLMILATLAFTCGVILDSVTRARLEAKRMHYLTIPAPKQ